MPTLSQAWNKVLLPSSSKQVVAPGASKAIYNMIQPEKRLPKLSPIILLKAKKNPTEIVGMENAHVRDGAAMCNFLAYLEARVSKILYKLMTLYCMHLTARVVQIRMQMFIFNKNE